MEEEEILTQDDEDDMSELEDEIKEEEEIKKPMKKVGKKEETISGGESDQQQVNETYEGFMQPARLGIVNTITGEIIEGFEIGKDEGIVQLGKVILNKLDKIAIVSGV